MDFDFFQTKMGIIIVITGAVVLLSLLIAIGRVTGISDILGNLEFVKGVFRFG